MKITQEHLEKRLAMVREQGAKAAAVVEQCRGAEMILMELFAELQMPEPVAEVDDDADEDEKAWASVDDQEQAGNMDGLSDC